MENAQTRFPQFRTAPTTTGSLRDLKRHVCEATIKPTLRRPLELSLYTSIAFGKRCKQLGVRPSTGSVGDAYDNAKDESFFATLETELLGRNTFRSHAQARMAIFEFIEGFYNPADATQPSVASPRSSTRGVMDQTGPRKWKLPWSCRSPHDPHSPLKAALRLPRVPTSLLLRVPKLQALRCLPK